MSRLPSSDAIIGRVNKKFDMMSRSKKALTVEEKKLLNGMKNANKKLAQVNATSSSGMGESK